MEKNILTPYPNDIPYLLILRHKNMVFTSSNIFNKLTVSVIFSEELERFSKFKYCNILFEKTVWLTDYLSLYIPILRCTPSYCNMKLLH